MIGVQVRWPTVARVTRFGSETSATAVRKRKKKPYARVSISGGEITKKKKDIIRTRGCDKNIRV
jgi:hypothetical protein